LSIGYGLLGELGIYKLVIGSNGRLVLLGLVDVRGVLNVLLADQLVDLLVDDGLVPTDENALEVQEL
jgi:hypothetical protein